MPLAYLSLGSNQGDRRGYLEAAVRRLRATPGVRVTAVSPVYQTAPHGEGYEGLPPFLNAAVAVDTDLAPQSLLRLLLEIEHQLGRVRPMPRSARTLDLDLLLYGEQVWDLPELTLPHPRMADRAFVLRPLADIAPAAVHPVLKRTARDLLGDLTDADRQAVALPKPPPGLAADTFRGVRVLVTGSTSGIGRATAEAFAAAGADVLVHGRRADVAQAAADQLRAFGGDCRAVVADLADPAACDKLATQAWDPLGSGLGVLVCNAGADTLTGDAAKWPFERKLQELLAVDLVATMRLGRAVGERMKAAGRGVILTVGWDQAETGMEGDSGQLFAAVKAGVMGFTRSLALTLAPQVRVNCVAPGWVRTAWGETAGAAWQDRVRRETPLGVWGLPDDVAAAAVWLASPAAGFVTGQTIRVNGGAVR
jgi:2-amino-4-hydroxy-6-hydroxymethyldihydropteridine diphosphokinase